MKLNAEQIAAVKQQTDADPIAEDNPVTPKLREAFGDHTFYVGETGLLVPERIDSTNSQSEPAEMMQVAIWANEERGSLQPVPWQATGYTLDLAGPSSPSGGQGSRRTED